MVQVRRRLVGLGLGAVAGRARADLVQRHVLGRVHYLGAGARGRDQRTRVGRGRLHVAVFLCLYATRRRRRRRGRTYRRVAVVGSV